GLTLRHKGHKEHKAHDKLFVLGIKTTRALVVFVIFVIFVIFVPERPAVARLSGRRASSTSRTAILRASIRRRRARGLASRRTCSRSARPRRSGRRPE